MKKKIFVAVNLPERVKKELEKYQEKISKSFNDFCPIKWTRKDNLHITLFFIGYVDFDELIDIFNEVERAVKKCSSFNVKMENISYAPKKENPKMVWVKGEKSPEMTKINKELEKNLFETNGESNDFIPHVTLGRIIQWQFKRIDLEERPEILEDINISFTAESIEIMESIKGGYVTLKSINL